MFGVNRNHKMHNNNPLKIRQQGWSNLNKQTITTNKTRHNLLRNDEDREITFITTNKKETSTEHLRHERQTEDKKKKTVQPH